MVCENSLRYAQALDDGGYYLLVKEVVQDEDNDQHLMIQKNSKIARNPAVASYEILEAVYDVPMEVVRGCILYVILSLLHSQDLYCLPIFTHCFSAYH